MNKIKRKKFIKTVVILLLILYTIILRVQLFRYINPDLHNYVVPWFDYINKNGGLLALGNYAALTRLSYAYSPPYLYLMSAALPLTRFLTPIEIIKIISVCFDYISAFYVYKMIEMKHPIGFFKWIGFFGVLFAPTVFINSAYWGQCDGIYTAFLIMSIYYIFTRKYSTALILFTVAFIFKVQAMILAPVFILLTFNRTIKWRLLFLAPLSYFAGLIPAFIVGYPILGTFTTYLDQTDSYHALSMNAPTLYAFVSNRFYDMLSPLGGLFGLVCCGLLIWVVLRSKTELTNEKLILFIITIFTVMPYILPKMHERYFYPASIAAIMLPFYWPKFRMVPIVLQCTSLLSYMIFLRGYEILPLAIPALINGILVIVLLYSLIRSFPPNEPSQPEDHLLDPG